MLHLSPVALAVQVLLVAYGLRAAALACADGAAPVGSGRVVLPFEIGGLAQVTFTTVFAKHLITYWVKTCKDCTPFRRMLTEMAILVLIAVRPACTHLRRIVHRHVHHACQPCHLPRIHLSVSGHAIEAILLYCGQVLLHSHVLL